MVLWKSWPWFYQREAIVYRVATQSGFSDFLDFVRILKISQDIHDKAVIFAESHDEVRIFLNCWKFLLSRCLILGMTWKGLVSIFLKNCWFVPCITELFWRMITQWFLDIYLIWLFNLGKRLTLNLVKLSLAATWMDGSWDPFLHATLWYCVLIRMIFINSY